MTPLHYKSKSMRIRKSNSAKLNRPRIRKSCPNDLERVNDTGLKHVHKLVFGGIIAPESSLLASKRAVLYGRS